MAIRPIMFIVLMLSLTHCRAIHDSQQAELSAEDAPRLTEVRKSVCGGVASVYAISSKGPETQDRSPSAQLGSAFAIHSDGFFMTNQHVIAHAKEVSLTFDESCTGRQPPVRAIVVAEDEKNDVALLQIAEKRNFTPLVAGEQSTIEPGEDIFVIGNALGLPNSIQKGIIGAVERSISIPGNRRLSPVFQLSASINPGNSGGPLFTMRGNVIGVVSAKSGSGEGTGFAIYFGQARSNIAKVLLAKRKELYREKFEGLHWREEQIFGTPRLVVEKIDPSSPAESASFKIGDILRREDTQSFYDLLDYELFMRSASSKGQYHFRVSRGQMLVVLHFRPVPEILYLPPVE